MSPKIKKWSFLLACLGGFQTVQAQVVYTPGDILVGFQAASGVGNSNNYVYNLGQGHSFRSATITLTVGNIGADLQEIYGANWFTRPELQWTIAGVRSNASFGSEALVVVNGDPSRTLYIGKAATGRGTSTPNATLASGSISTGANKMVDAQNGFTTTNGIAGGPPRSPTAGSAGRGVNQSTSSINSWSSIVGTSPFGIFTNSVKQAFGGSANLSHLDLYRILGRNDLANTVEPANPGVSVLQGTFTLNALGEIKFEPPVSASAYDTWANSFNLIGAERAVDADLDGDGLDNGAEFVVGGHPKLGNDGDKIPTLTVVSGGAVEFVFRRTDISSYLNPKAQYDSDLIGTWTPAVNGVGGVVITTLDEGFGAGIDRVTVRIPITSPAQFVRLVVDN